MPTAPCPYCQRAHRSEYRQAVCRGRAANRHARLYRNETPGEQLVLSLQRAETSTQKWAGYEFLYGEAGQALLGSLLQLRSEGHQWSGADDQGDANVTPDCPCPYCQPRKSLWEHLREDAS